MRRFERRLERLENGAVGSGSGADSNGEDSGLTDRQLSHIDTMIDDVRERRPGDLERVETTEQALDVLTGGVIE